MSVQQFHDFRHLFRRCQLIQIVTTVLQFKHLFGSETNFRIDIPSCVKIFNRDGVFVHFNGGTQIIVLKQRKRTNRQGGRKQKQTKSMFQGGGMELETTRRVNARQTKMGCTEHQCRGKKKNYKMWE